MAKESTSAYIFAIVGIVLIVGIVFVVQNLKMSSVSLATTTDTTGQVYSSAISSEACATYQCSDNEISICYSNDDGDCSCPPCSTESTDLTG